MLRLCINSRDELFIINLEELAYLQANGNYTLVVYIGGQQLLVSLGLSHLEEMIRQVYSKNQGNPFVRLGRSYLINQKYLYQIHVLKQKLTLSDFRKNIYSLTISKILLKQYKDIIQKQYGKK